MTFANPTIQGKVETDLGVCFPGDTGHKKEDRADVKEAIVQRNCVYCGPIKVKKV